MLSLLGAITQWPAYDIPGPEEAQVWAKNVHQFTMNSTDLVREVHQLVRMIRQAEWFGGKCFILEKLARVGIIHGGGDGNQTSTSNSPAIESYDMKRLADT